MTIDQLADEFDLSVATIRKYLRRGMPKAGKGTKKEPLEFDANVCARWMKENNLAGKGGRPAGPFAERINEAKLRQILAKASIAEFDDQTRRGHFIAKDVVEKQNVQKFSTIRNQLLGLPASVAPILAGLDTPEIERQLDEKVREALEELSGT